MADTKGKSKSPRKTKSTLAEVSSGEKQDYKSYESIFKIKRIEAGIDSRDLAKILRIKHEYLIAIEDEDLNRIPGRVYAAGYKRMYANYFNIDLQELENSVLESKKKSTASEHEKEDYNLFASSLWLLSFLTVLIMFLVYIFFIHNKITPNEDVISKLSNTADNDFGGVRFPYEKEYDFGDFYDR